MPLVSTVMLVNAYLMILLADIRRSINMEFMLDSENSHQTYSNFVISTGHNLAFQRDVLKNYPKKANSNNPHKSAAIEVLRRKKTTALFTVQRVIETLEFRY